MRGKTGFFTSVSWEYYMESAMVGSANNKYHLQSEGSFDRD
jgi:hypothetical protein